MKTAFFSLFIFGLTSVSLAQTLVGEWQLVKENSCIDEKLPATSNETKAMVSDMKSMGPAALQQVVTFKEKMNGEETTRILTRKKTANGKSFMYRFDGESLVILDKKSHTITDSFIVDKFTADSLIISDASRPCEMRMFRRIK